MMVELMVVIVMLGMVETSATDGNGTNAFVHGAMNAFRVVDDDA